jgi:hypothetical protein
MLPHTLITLLRRAGAAKLTREDHPDYDDIGGAMECVPSAIIQHTRTSHDVMTLRRDYLVACGEDERGSHRDERIVAWAEALAAEESRRPEPTLCDTFGPDPDWVVALRIDHLPPECA